MKLWHDDVRPAPEGWVWARTNDEAKDYLLSGEVVEISLDNDLGFQDVVIPDNPDDLAEVLFLKGQGAEEGIDLVRWMIANEIIPTKITIHSWNPARAREMAILFAEVGATALVQPFRVPRALL